MTKSRASAAALLVAMFVLGGLVGGAATRMADQKGHRREGRPPRPTFVDRLTSDLGLNDSQRDSVQMVLDRHQPAMDSLWATVRLQFGPQMQAERQKIRNEISRFLTPEQQAKYAGLQRQDSLRRAEGDRSRNGRR